MSKSEAEEINYSALDLQLNFAQKNLDFDDVYLYTFVILGIFAIFALIAVFLPENATNIIFIFGIFVAIYLWWKTMNDFENKKTTAFKSFATKNKFIFTESSNTFGPGTIFTHGRDKLMTYIVGGEFSGNEFKFYEYSHTIGSGKSQKNYKDTVIEISLPRKLPHMVIDSLVEPGNYATSTLPIKFHDSQRIDLEGDFYKYFALYAPDKYGVTMLSIIAPDVMETLVDHAILCDIEIIDDRLYFYWTDSEISAKIVEKKFSTVEKILEQIGGKLSKSDIFAVKSHAQLHSTASKAVRLASSKWNPIFVMVIIVLISTELLSFVAPDYAEYILLIIYVFILWWAWGQYKKYVFKKQILERFKKKQ